MIWTTNIDIKKNTISSKDELSFGIKKYVIKILELFFLLLLDNAACILPE